MSAHQGFRVAATTTGISSSPYEHLRKNYVYGGVKTGDGTAERPGNFTPCGEAQHTLRAQRIRDFARALASLGAEDPATATIPQVIAAGVKVGVGEKTARAYRAALKKQQGGGNG